MAAKVKVIRLKDRPFALRYFDPATGTERQQSAGTHDRKEAEEKARSLAEQLAAGRLTEQMTWAEFLDRFERERMPALSAGSRETYAVTFRLFERSAGTVLLRAVSASVLSLFQAWLRNRGLKEITIQKHLRQVRVALQWAYDLELIDRVPAMPRVVRGSIPKTMKGRPLSDDEFRLYLEAIGDVVGEPDVEAWRFFCEGLWWQGLRVSEALVLSWDDEGYHRVDLSEAYGFIWIRGDLEKGRRDRKHPMAPEFQELLNGVPAGRRHGRVFKLPFDERTRVCHMGSAIGRRAGVLVRRDTGTGKARYATLHDLRRSCALRWAERLMPQELMEFMRHSSIQVTMDYYVGQRATQVAALMHAAKKGQIPVVSGDDKEHNCKATCNRIPFGSSEVVEN